MTRIDTRQRQLHCPVARRALKAWRGINQDRKAFADVALVLYDDDGQSSGGGRRYCHWSFRRARLKGLVRQAYAPGTGLSSYPNRRERQPSGTSSVTVVPRPGGECTASRLPTSF